MFTLYGHDDGPQRWVDVFRVIDALVAGSRNDQDMFLFGLLILFVKLLPHAPLLLEFSKRFAEEAR
jgi:hypothetical protein